MKSNRSMPEGVIIPELGYPSVPAAVEWLCRCFGFTARLRMGDHRAQLTFGPSGLVVTQSLAAAKAKLMVRVDDVDAHHAQAVREGAPIVSWPADFAYGERQYTAHDLGGHTWVFSQTVSDVDPSSWL